MRAIRILLLVAAFAAGLYYIAWWIVPLVAAVFAMLYRDRGAPLESALGVLAASLILLAPGVMFPAFGTLLRQLGEIFPVPGVAVLLLGVLLSMTLAFTAARVAIGVVGTRRDK